MALRRFQRVSLPAAITGPVRDAFERLQDAIEAALQGVSSSPVADSVRMDQIALVTGENTIRHTLGRVPTVFPSDPRVTLISATSSTLVLSASADVTCSLLLM